MIFSLGDELEGKTRFRRKSIEFSLSGFHFSLCLGREEGVHTYVGQCHRRILRQEM